MTAIKKLHARWKKRTPDKYKKLGRAIALLGTMIQVATGGMQLSGDIMTKHQYFIFVIVLALLQWAGQTVTDLATDDDEKIVDNIQNGQV